MNYYSNCAVVYLEVLKKAVHCRQGMQRQCEEKIMPCFSFAIHASWLYSLVF